MKKHDLKNERPRATVSPLRHFRQWTLTLGLLLLLAQGGQAGEVREFVLAGTDRALSEAPPEVQVIFRAMRFNDLSEQWNVDVTVTNRGAQSFSGVIVLAIDGFSGTTGPLRTDGF